MFYFVIGCGVVGILVQIWANILAHKGRVPPTGPCAWAFKVQGVEGWGLGVRVHEWTHLATGAGVVLPVLSNFGWLIFYDGSSVWTALLWGAVLNLCCRRLYEAVADIAAMFAVGPRAYAREVRKLYRKESGYASLAGTVLLYPVWRVWWFWQAIRS